MVRLNVSIPEIVNINHLAAIALGPTTMSKGKEPPRIARRCAVISTGDQCICAVSQMLGLTASTEIWGWKTLTPEKIRTLIRNTKLKEPPPV